MDDAVVAKFVVLWELHERYRGKAGLSALMTPTTFVVDLILDSLQIIPLLPASEDQVVGDIGSGAGFPALPIAIINPGLRINCIEPAPKKAAYLRLAAAALELKGVTVTERRVEELRGMTFGRAWTKAFRRPQKALKAAVGITGDRGLIDLYLTTLTPELETYAAGLGCAVTEFKPYTLPGKRNERVIAEFQRGVSRETLGTRANVKFHVKQGPNLP